MFYIPPRTSFNFSATFILLSANAFDLNQSRYLSFGKELKRYLNSSPNNKILGRSKFEALADDKMNVNEKLNYGLGRVENIVGKGVNAGYQHFLCFSECFQKACTADT